MKLENIRNFSIIAHVDHGKSTLSDRLLEATGTIEKRNMKAQLLDRLDIERERGITIKSVPVRMKYRAQDGGEYIMNLIDTPGHVDFSYEVSRSLAACEGAILVVDAAQGVEAQTVANSYLATDLDLELVPILNKIDLPSAHPEQVKRELEEIIGINADDAIPVSAKTGEGIPELLERIVRDVPPPSGEAGAPLQALIFDSVYDNYKGVICYVRVMNGTLEAGKNVRFMATGRDYQIDEVGVFKPDMVKVERLGPGEVGFICASIKTIDEAHVGDTITDSAKPAAAPLAGYKKVKPVVFCGFYPVEREDINQLREALEKLQINDSAISFEPENSAALGFGFRCGFLGLLHMEIAKERLNREFGVDLVATAPNVVYQIVQTDGSIIEAHRPSDFPDPVRIEEIREPYIKLSIFMPEQFVGAAMQLCQDKRGTYVAMDYITPERVRLTYDMPLAEFILDFHDRLKSCTRGYASLDYDHTGFRAANLVKVDVLLQEEPVDAFSFICHADQAYHRGHAVVGKLKELIPRQLFEVPVQAAVGKKVIVRMNIKAVRKDVLAKCYGGDITRKRKLLEKQKEGKKRMKQVGRVSIPQEAFLAFMDVTKAEDK
ncbi:translation elongation factor 4 [Cloacibacillus porcorum]|jgi:GTP-binding protein LepA|uniref:Elongation factor 4 n=1 Tax=Cloacibacillus porcorum TaxID=1197717 RepID=A0A1B2I408_9BACT|nr:translation elongation factor 4 [Cloacibacillus porcorum]ANZ44699.1 elongation factor 4 [Cloacibacillus porcorum]MCC8184673.1 translation elongation factor 4 [Cloacibacillus porcorum]MCD7877314.1 translation elongation factor 4 [Cloacibacillus porcorum]MCI5866450.1 translation elongation factor 4 [Cloacibacillus porcorum]MDD7650202.1 translation elongation factor 4 [Cloacibacillus porcorum]